MLAYPREIKGLNREEYVKLSKDVMKELCCSRPIQDTGETVLDQVLNARHEEVRFAFILRSVGMCIPVALAPSFPLTQSRVKRIWKTLIGQSNWC